MEISLVKVCRHASFQLSLLITIICLLVPSFGMISLQRSPYPETITFYLHGTISLTTFIIINPVTSTSNVGLMTVGMEPLTVGPSLSSKKVGNWSSLDVETGQGAPFSSMLIPATIKYDDGKRKGSIVMQGVVDYNAKNEEVAVLGGTGDFLGATGYAVRNFVSNTVIGNITDTVIRYKLHLFHCKAAYDTAILNSLQ